MRLELVGSGQTLGLDHDPSIFTLARRFELECPALFDVERAAHPLRVEGEQLEQLLRDIDDVLVRYQRERREELRRENNIYSRDAHEVEAVISGLMATDDTVYHLSQVAELCATLVRREGELTVNAVPVDPVSADGAVS